MFHLHEKTEERKRLNGLMAGSPMKVPNATRMMRSASPRSSCVSWRTRTLAINGFSLARSVDQLFETVRPVRPDAKLFEDADAFLIAHACADYLLDVQVLEG